MGIETFAPNPVAVYQGREIDAVSYRLTRELTGEVLDLDQVSRPTLEDLDAAIAAFMPEVAPAPPASPGLISGAVAWVRARAPFMGRGKRLTASP